MPDNDVTVCVICGRAGTRGFVESCSPASEGRMCGNDRACMMRANARGYSWPWMDGHVRLTRIQHAEHAVQAAEPT